MVDGSSALEELARARGVQFEYYDALGQHRRAPTDSLLAVLRALGEPVERPEDAADALKRPVERANVAVLWDGAGEVALPGEGPLRVVGESDLGARWERELVVQGGRAAMADVPMGVHALRRADDGAHLAWLLSAPTRCFEAPGRRWGLFAPLYAIHDAITPDIGDFGTLRRAVRRTRDLGGDVFATLPLLPTFVERGDPSPYAPVSRLFWSELFVDPRPLPELEASPEARRLLEAGPPAQGAFVDYDAVGAHRFAILEALAGAVGGARKEALAAWLRAHPTVEDYVAHRTARGPWAGDAGKQAMLRYAQWVAEAQLEAVDHEGGLYLDLPLGVHCDGFDVARWSDRFVKGCSAGAPPDGLFEGGQDWGFPPMHPERDRATGWAYLRACLEHHVRHASVLRIDHVAWLHRLYWVPQGASATEGAYVHQTQPEELYALLSMLSHRHECSVIGEDLGTVPDAVREAMTKHALQRTWVFYFAVRHRGWDPPTDDATATINTHDLPTFAGWWRGRDIDDWVELGLYEPERAEQEKGAADSMLVERSASWASTRSSTASRGGRD